MYTIKMGQNTIYSSADKDTYPVGEPKLKLATNDAGSCNFTLYPGHPLYNGLISMRSFITVYEDQEELFYGRVLETEKNNISSALTVFCEGAFTFFLDSELEKEDRTETIAEFIAHCVSVHNSQVEAEKQFTVGQITADKAVEIDPKTGTTIKIKFEIKDYTQVKAALESMITSKYGGFFRVRPNPNGPHFLDYVQTYGRVNTQRVKLTENVMDKSDHVSGQNIFTILRPLGKNNMTIASLSQSNITLSNVVKDGEKLRLTDKIAQYGSIIRTERFSEIDDASMLLKAAEEFIQRRGSMLPASCPIGAVDWHLMNPDVMGIRLGDVFTDIDGFTGVNMTVGEMDLDLSDPANNQYTFKNPEEIAANDPASSSSSLSSSYASRCQHIDYIYKYIHEGDNQLQLATEQIMITAEKTLQLSGILTNITGGQVYIVADLADDPDNPGQKTTGEVRLVARRVDPDTGESTTELSVGMNNITITNGKLIVDEIETNKAKIENLMAGHETATSLRATTVHASNFYYRGSLCYFSDLTLMDGDGNPISVRVMRGA